jgi:hypothetical protein
MSKTESKYKPKKSFFNNFQDAVMINSNTKQKNTKGVPSMTSWSSRFASVFTKKPTETEEERKKKEENQRQNQENFIIKNKKKN